MTALSRHRLPLVVLLPALVLLAGLRAADDRSPDWKGFLSRDESKALAAFTKARLDAQLKLLESGKLDDDDRERILARSRGLTLLMAAYLQSEKGASKLHAAWRDKLLNLDKALRGGDVKQARALFTRLGGPGGARDADPTPRDLHDPKDREDLVIILMKQYKTRDYGGLGVEPMPKDDKLDGIEALLRVLAARPGDVPKLTPEELARLANQSAVMAQWTRSLCPEKAVRDRTPEKWRQYCDELRDASLELAQAARDDKADQARAAARKINASCANCHRTFRGR